MWDNLAHKKYSQLPLAVRHLLETRKAKLFLQAADEGLEDRLLILLGDRTTEGGFTNDWRRVEETITLLAKQLPCVVFDSNNQPLHQHLRFT